MNQKAVLNFRQYVCELEEEGDLIQINEPVDPHLELAAITRRCYELPAPAPLFNNVQGQQANGLFRILGAPVGLNRTRSRRFGKIAKSIGLPNNATWEDISAKILEAKTREPISPTTVTQAVCKENKIFGRDVDLEALPVPLHHQADGGRYIQTFGMYIVQSPCKKWVNWSITRGMVAGKRSIVSPVMPLQDIGVIHKLWKEEGKDMPFALCFGVPPAAIMASGMPIPQWTNESGYVGAIAGAGVEVIKCETSDLMVPANAEIVIEGVVSKDKTALEGPMAEFHGLVFPGEQHPCPIFEVEAITFRNDPILPLCIAGKATEENHTVGSIMQISELLDLCREADLPIKMIWSPFEAHMLWHVFQVDREKLVGMNTDVQKFSKRVGEVVFNAKIGWQISRVYLVGDDIDCTSLNEVVWAEATRCEPGTHDVYFYDFPSMGLFPYISHGSRPEGWKPGKVVKCCMMPMEFSSTSIPWQVGSFKGSYPEDLQRRVVDRWTALGFEDVGDDSLSKNGKA